MASGLQFDLDALLASAETVARVPIFLAALTLLRRDEQPAVGAILEGSA